MRTESEKENIRDISPSQVRIPTALKEKLKLAAKQKNQSMAAEIVERLQESFIAEELEKVRLEKIEEKLDEVLKRLDKAG